MLQTSTPVSLVFLKDPNVFEGIYDRYAPAIYGVLLRSIHCEKLAAQVLEKIFVKAWANCGDFSCMEAQLFKWLLQHAILVSQNEFNITLNPRDFFSKAPVTGSEN